jgi:phosphohistidine swiveling domain-containing protein
MGLFQLASKIKIILKTLMNSDKGPILTGLAASSGVKSGKARVIKSISQLSEIAEGEILVAPKTTPDFMLAFGKVAGVVTDHGGVTSHAAIVSREMGIPAVVGTKTATQVLTTGQLITVDGNTGKVYEGKVDLETDVPEVPKVRLDEYTGNDIEDLLTALTQGVNDVTELWPLKPGQFIPYYDVGQVIDVYHKLKQLINEGKSYKQIADLFRYPTVIRLFLLDSGLLGFKAARVLKIEPVTLEDQMEFMNIIFKLLRQFCPDDLVCLKGTNYLWNENEVSDFISKNEWTQLSEPLKKAINLLNVNLITYIWSFFWDYYPHGSAEVHGPYLINSDKLKDEKTLLVKDHFDLAPTEVWPVAKELPFKSLILAQSYGRDGIYLNYGNRIKNKESLVDDNHFFNLQIDGKTVNNEEEILKISETLADLTKKQVEYVNSLPDIDKARQGSRLAYYCLKNFYSHFDPEWYPKERVEAVIKQFGDNFLIKGQKEQDRNAEEKRKFFDPRNDYL